MPIQNTSKDAEDPLHALTMALGGIERQEAHGQAELAHDTALPTEGLDVPEFAQWGVVSKGARAGDPLFSDVVYERSPDGVLRYTETVTPKCDGCGAVARYTLRDDPMTYWCVDCAKEA